MAEDLAPVKPAHITPALSMSLWATTQSQMEVVVPKGKGKKRSHQDLGADEAAQFLPLGMVIHLDPSAKCMGAPHPVQAAAPMASLSVAPQLSMVSSDKEGDVIVVHAGKGKGASGQAKGVTVNKVEFKEVMRQLLICE
ncbi:hypothetical protein PAXRUDRAFT_19199 [Paxillus rubicundulus Ve08.2h10]|uniref:Uncharacterized protein n=1 Tax=Paxillus rubicundulus Ve08.2h10 TaxID=930991 RepID=A0A0D0D569_9AGAM|nr:hypothetical protein PAXRUDRAFT_19199 [Paxillus rubicundulus Ve08.2h10]